MASISDDSKTVPYNRTRLFVASCVALVTTAMTFAIRGDVLNDFGREFSLSNQLMGWITLVGIWGFPIAILIGGPLCDYVGMGRLLRTASLGHVLGVILTILSPIGGYPMLLAATLVLGLSNGLVEAVINPLAATMYSDQKTHKLNMLHAFWPAGLVIGGVLAMLISLGFGLGHGATDAIVSLSWKIKYGTILISAILYYVLLIGQKFPSTERVQAGVSGGEMFREALRPGFIFLLFCMCLTAITELGPDGWIGAVMSKTVHMQTGGIIFLVYTSGFMFILRFFAGPLVKRLTPAGLLACCAALSAIGLFWLSFSFTAGMAFLAATVFAFGKTFFWPTMLGVTSERYPRGGSLLLAMMGAVGNFAAGGAAPIMGQINDAHTLSSISSPAVRDSVVGKEGQFNVRAAVNLEALAKKPDPVGELNSVVAAIKAAEARGPVTIETLPDNVKDYVKGGDGAYDPRFAATLEALAAKPNPAEDISASAAALSEAEKQGAASSFRYVAVLPVVLVVLFGVMFIFFVTKGGYRPVHVSDETGTG